MYPRTGTNLVPQECLAPGSSGLRGLAEETVVTAREVRAVAEAALRLQELLLRRAWGVFYAAWSGSMLVSIFVTPIVAASFPSAFTIVPHVIVNMAVSGIAVVATVTAFRRVRDTAEVRRAIGTAGWTRLLSYRAFASLWAAVYAVVILVLAFFISDIVNVVLLVYAVMLLYAFYALKLSFPRKLPIEGMVALSSLAIVTAGTATLRLIFAVDSTAPYALAYGMVLLIWAAASWNARRQRLPGVAYGGISP